MRIFIAISLVALLPQASGERHRVIASPRPRRLEGWTISYPIRSYHAMPRTLVIARDGDLLDRIDGRPLIFTWMQRELGDSATGRHRDVSPTIPRSCPGRDAHH